MGSVALHFKKTVGIILVIISAAIFGFTPILCKFASEGGSNPVMIAFSRMAISLPILYLCVKLRNISLKISSKEFFYILLTALIGSGGTTLALYTSYEYISVGISTTIHFAYPAAVCFVCIAFFKEKANTVKIVSILLSLIGVAMFFNGHLESNGKMGVFLSAVSVITYTFYIVFMDKTGLSQMYAFKLSFYICLINSVFFLFYGMFKHQIVFYLPVKTWLLQIAVSVLISVFGITFLQMGIHSIGASNAALFSLFEPIFSVVLGVVLLKEDISAKAFLGCLLIISAVGIIPFSEKNKSETISHAN